jgi:lactate dehydrogenase-like 2-hydroxyacid dehydrogenase
MAWALLFAVARRVPESDKYNRSGMWEGWGPMQFLGGDVTGATLGVVGAGRIGTAFALKSRGFEMNVLYADVKHNELLERELGAQRKSIDDLLRESDYVSIHVPLVPETFHLISTEQFKLMKRTAYLVNTSRGPVIDESALVEALRSGEIAGAGLDVYEDEPRMTAGLAELDNVVLSAHTASATVSTRSKMAVMAATNLVAMLKGTPIPNLVNPEVLQR